MLPAALLVALLARAAEQEGDGEQEAEQDERPVGDGDLLDGVAALGAADGVAEAAAAPPAAEVRLAQAERMRPGGPQPPRLLAGVGAVDVDLHLAVRRADQDRVLRSDPAQQDSPPMRQPAQCREDNAGGQEKHPERLSQMAEHGTTLLESLAYGSVLGG